MSQENNIFDLAFCTTCRNRLKQLNQTLESNLSLLEENQMISLVDFGSSDGLSDWIWKNFESDIKNKKLSFFQVTNSVNWSSPKAKNLAHRLAPAKYLFNLDADNSLDISDLNSIRHAAKNNQVTHQFSGDWRDGSVGRIGIPKDLFLKIGGYDEALLPMSVQDIDLLNRVHSLQIKILKLSPPSKPAIQNSFEDKMANIKDTKSDALNFYRIFNRINLSLSKVRLKHEGALRLGGFATYEGILNGVKVRIDGFDNISILN